MATPQGAGEGNRRGGSSPPRAPTPAALLSPPMSPESAAATAAAAIANARWTPAKEQIAVLEGLYNQGMRTPTAEQIQQVTARLREHGHIEGKNVFYWFQNHKARQRQKQKQQSFAYFSSLLRRPPPLPVLHMPPTRPFPAPLVPLHRTPTPTPTLRTPPPPPPPPQPQPQPPASACNREVMYQPQSYSMTAAPQAAANGASYYYQQRQMPAMHQRMEMPAPAPMYQQAAANDARNHLRAAVAKAVRAPRETLELFPLQPTFMLPADNTRRSESASVVPTASASSSYSGDPEICEGANGEAVPFYDFFGMNSGGR